MLAPRPPRAPYRGKRLFDLAVVALVAVPVLIVCALVAVAVRCSSPGPVLFRQERVGRDGRRFRILKFRTMVDGDNPLVDFDDRITPVGRLLRRSSLDELPQLWNVVRGEMSIVGPRPTLAYQAERWDRRQRGRLAVRPGLTGLAQVRGRNALTWAERIEWDLRYVETQSIRRDLAILARTLMVVATGHGVEATSVPDPLAAPEPAPRHPVAALAGPPAAAPVRPEPVPVRSEPVPVRPEPVLV
ncbi:MAG: sugar transferase [Actinomyces sp.]|nr:MAG: sugar transferase [Actinomyces sp.]